MSLVYTPELPKLLRGANLLLDTCAIIDASKCEDFDGFLVGLSEIDCSLFSLPSVKEEFTCSADSLTNYNKLTNYIESLQIIFLNSTEKNLMNSDGIFSIVLRRCNVKNPSHVDRMLMATSYYYYNSGEKMYLMTANYKDVPNKLFKRVGFISYEIGKISNISVFEFNGESFQKMAEKIE